ncbi:hypothetical protein EDC01DRAFT_759706 [Geopyxis carbonaria]|nr:hypothetical protein EDC01DRAFT_759706 [Geopyxis carbonaria]
MVFTRHFLLIGINTYLPAAPSPPAPPLPRVLQTLKPLTGAVRDALMFHVLFRTLYPSAHITLLTSPPVPLPPPSPTSPAQPSHSSLPSRDAILDALSAIAAAALPGDAVHIHFSGHGAQVPSLPAYAALKRADSGAGAVDECLLPYDARATGAFLRDVELAALLATLVAAELHVSFVLDACNSGGLSRDASDTIPSRGVSLADATFPPGFITPPKLERRAAVERRLGEIVHAYIAGRTRRTWLLEPVGYELLAACGADEVARESVWGGEIHGTLSYTLHQALLDAQTHASLDTLTHGTLFRRLRTRVNIANARQTPVFIGNDARVLCAPASRLDIPGLAVWSQFEAYPERRRGSRVCVYIDAGALHGVTVGSEFKLVRWCTVEFGDAGTVARLRVKRVDAERAEVEFLDADGAVVGAADNDRAAENLPVTPRELLDAGYVAVLSRMSLENKTALFIPAAVDAALSPAERDELARTLRESLFATAAATADTASYILAVEQTPRKRFALTRRDGSPVPAVGTFRTLRGALGALLRLAQWARTLALRNPTPAARMLDPTTRAPLITATITSPAPASTSTATTTTSSASAPAASLHRVPANTTRIELAITNNTPRSVEISVLALFCPLRVISFFPRRHLGALPARETLPIAVELDAGLIGGGHAVGLKVFVTKGARDLRVLEMGGIEEDGGEGEDGEEGGKGEGSMGRTRGEDALKELMDALLGTRDARGVEAEWVVLDVEVVADEVEVEGAGAGGECPVRRMAVKVEEGEKEEGETEEAEKESLSGITTIALPASPPPLPPPPPALVL